MSGEPPITSKVSDIEELRAWIQSMIQLCRFVTLITGIISLVTRLCTANANLVAQVANLRVRRPKSEKLKYLKGQLELFAMAKKVESPSPPPEANEPPKNGRKGRHPGRSKFPDSLERVEVTNPVPAELRVCKLCGSEMTTVGHSHCQYLELIPAKIVVMVRLDERVACPNDDTIVSAPTPHQLIDRGILGTTLVVDGMCDKFIEHLPIERQCTSWARMGVPIAPQTLGRSVAAMIDLVTPIAKLIRDKTRGPGILSTDGTGIPVLDRDAPGGIRIGTMACWINYHWVTFDYSAVGDSASIKRFLADDFKRTVQCDGTSLTTFLERAGGKRPGCWAHARRRFVKAVRGGDALALEFLEMIARLFKVEAEALLASDTAIQRKDRRLRESVPILDDILKFADEKRGQIPPKSPLGQALGYLHRQWNRLKLFLVDGRIELTNNRVERGLRPLVLGRKNWLFTWKDLGGERIAAILTIIGTCIAHEIDPRAYLHLVAKLLIDRWPNSKLAELLPERLAQTHPSLVVVKKRPDRFLANALRAGA